MWGEDMSKKTKIIVGSLVTVILVGSISIYRLNNKNNNSDSINSSITDNTEQNENENIFEELTPEEVEKLEIKEPEGKPFAEVKENIVNLGLNKNSEGKLEYYEADQINMIIDISEISAIYTITNYTEKTKQTLENSLKEILPNKAKELIELLNSKEDQTISMDNRTVNINFNDSEIKIEIIQ